MKKTLLIILLISIYSIHANGADTIHFRRFGTLWLYRQKPFPAHVIFFLSGDGGWNDATDRRATDMSTLDALVVGVDTSYYLERLNAAPGDCIDVAADFENLSRVLEKHLQFPGYVPPILLGYSLGAPLVYSALVQAPPHTFEGAISMGFSPEIPGNRPLCRGQGLEWKTYSKPKEKGYSVLPSGLLKDPWLVFHGMLDQVDSEKAAQEFVNQVPNARLVPLPLVGHGFKIDDNWFPQFQQAFHIFGGTTGNVETSPSK